MAEDHPSSNASFSFQASEGEAMGLDQCIQAMKPHIVAILFIFGPRVAQPHDQLPFQFISHETLPFLR